MGYFSFVAQNSNKSILIYYLCGEIRQGTYFMWDNTGRIWKESEYEGYGEFGGKDYYVLLAEMNKYYDEDIDDDVKRSDGIEIAFNTHNENTLYPNLTDSLKWKWINKAPKDCPNQGFFK